jgi:hypothetical protein
LVGLLDGGDPGVILVAEALLLSVDVGHVGGGLILWGGASVASLFPVTDEVFEVLYCGHCVRWRSDE